MKSKQIEQTTISTRRRSLTARAAVTSLALATAVVPALAGDNSAAFTSPEHAEASRPFRVNIPDDALTDLHRRIAATHWPEKETVADQSQGVQLATIQELARYWATDYDWRKCEAKLNALRQFVTKIVIIPPGYRDWQLISVAREEGELDDVRAILGNDIAVKAYREGKLLFPEGAIIARIAWSLDASEENNKTFDRAQSFVAGAPKNGVQFMAKDSKKYAATGGWGYAHFNDGKPADAAFMQSCFPCHQAIKSRDFVFTRYSP